MPSPALAELGELHFHRLLVAVDGSDNADLALSAAVTAARRDHASVTVIAVATDLAMESARWAWAPACPEGLQQEADEGVQRILEEAVKRIPPDVPVTTLFRRGRAGEEIVKQAAAADYDAVLLGARGVGRVGTLMGSVSNHVLHHADTAVFVAHAPR
jgi:nucleotide-binding universal stress UspA family protein